MERYRAGYTWWIETSRLWIVRAYGVVNNEFQTKDFDKLLDYYIYGQGSSFAEIAQEWNISLEVLAELVADHSRRLE